MILLFAVLTLILSHSLNEVSAMEAAKLHGTSAHLMQQRYLLENNFHFSPLSCNDELETTPCQLWSDFFGTETKYEERVTIPCGECIMVDQKVLDLQGGLDIRGKLVFEPKCDNKFTLRSTLIAVQGELEINAANHVVSGSPLVEFVVYNNGQEEQYFEAQDENAHMCVLEEGCLAGRRAIVVAGGKLKINGVPPDTPSWLPLFDVIEDGDGDGDPSTTNKIIVDTTIRDKWASGAEILITSHTVQWNENQVRKIVAISDHPEDASKVIVELETPIVRPTTQMDDERFAVEVALLSKNIVWRAEADIPGDHDSELDGGHFWIMHTPYVQQLIEGVEVVNFGQQGNLGRYPIHFHLCGDVQGARISKNTIRHSNQRCVIVHGTDNLLIEENVAFDTKGHCFMLEDGIETGNKFVKNLGAHTDKPEKLIPNEGTNGDETDQERPSTFWITNPMNSWVGNVAAGSLSIGYWFELQLRGPLASLYKGEHPKKSPLTLFKDNVAHSSGTGIRTYPTGYSPKEQAKFENSHVYRNMHGAFFHISANYAILGGFFADNRLGLDLDRADNIQIRGTEFIGLSDTFQDQMKSHDSCGMIGLELHTWQGDGSQMYTTLEDVSFRDFGREVCPNNVPMVYDKKTKSGLFDYYIATKGISFDDSTDAVVRFCPPQSRNVNDVYLVDIDGTLRPKIDGEELAPERTNTNSNKKQEVSTLVAEKSSSLTFVDGDLCTDVPEHCYKYCEGVCFQSVLFNVDPSGTKDYSLKICSRNDRENCISVSGYQRERPGGDIYWSIRPRVFGAHLPVGKYTAVFLDENGTETWPSFVREVYEDSFCTNPLERGYIKLEEPKVAEGECTDLIRNGKIQSDDTRHDPDPLWPWMYRFGSMALGTGEGIGGSDAVRANPDHKTPTIIQFLDTRCIRLLQNRVIQFKASIKLVDKEGQPVTCDPTVSQKCPQIGLQAGSRRYEVATVGKGTDDDGYQVAEGFLTIDEGMLAAKDVMFYARSFGRMYMYIDNVSMKLSDEKSNKDNKKNMKANIFVRPLTFDDEEQNDVFDEELSGLADDSDVPSIPLDASSSSRWDLGCHASLVTLIFVMGFIYNLY